VVNAVKMPFLKDPSASFIRAAALRVNNWLFTPGQICSRAGDLAQELYYIKYGEVCLLGLLIRNYNVSPHRLLIELRQPNWLR